MKTILLDTALMVGITFTVGFIVAALIKLVTRLLSFTQENSLKDVLKMWRHYSKLNVIRRLRIEAISRKEEVSLEMFDYSLSLNPRDKKRNSDDAAGFSDYPVSYNKK